MGRATPALRPPTAAATARVPDVSIDGQVFRAQWSHHRPWWFSTRTDNPWPGRFDLAAPHGTCYFADDPVAAIIEKLADPAQPVPLIPHEDLERLRVWRGPLPSPWNVVADTTDRASRVPKELGTSVPYEVPWSWADALHDDGRSGLRYWLRFDPGAGRGIAVFAESGEPDAPPWLRYETAAFYVDDLRASFDIIEPTITFAGLLAADEP